MLPTFGRAALSVGVLVVATGSASAGDLIRLGGTAPSPITAAQAGDTHSLKLTDENAEDIAVGGFYRGGFYRGGYFGGYRGGYFGGYRGFHGGGFYRPFYGYGGFRSFYPGFGGFGGYRSFYPGFGYQPFYNTYYAPFTSYYYAPLTSYYVAPYPYCPIGGTLGAPAVSLNITPSFPAIPPANLPAPRVMPPSATESQRPYPQQGQTFPYDGGPRAPVPGPAPDAAPQAAPPVQPTVPTDGLPVSLPVKLKKPAYPAYGDEKTVKSPNRVG